MTWNQRNWPPTVIVRLGKDGWGIPFWNVFAFRGAYRETIGFFDRECAIRSARRQAKAIGAPVIYREKRQ